jgi:predicted DNA-binding transcriptional regulator AlpA
LITLKQIELEHGVSRSALHTYRRSASFPQPVPVEGSTKTQYRAAEVAAWFDANPKQQGKKRDQFVSHEQGDPMAVTADPSIAALTEAVDAALKSLRGGYHHLAPLTEAAVAEAVVEAVAPVMAAHRASVLREAADALDESETLRDLTDDHMHDVNAATNELRRMANEGAS